MIQWKKPIQEWTRKADFVCIRETHNTKDIEIKCENYKIFFPKASSENSVNKGIGCVAIMVINNLVNTIKNIKEPLTDIWAYKCKRQKDKFTDNKHLCATYGL